MIIEKQRGASTHTSILWGVRQLQNIAGQLQAVPANRADLVAALRGQALLTCNAGTGEGPQKCDNIKDSSIV